MRTKFDAPNSATYEDLKQRGYNEIFQQVFNMSLNDKKPLNPPGLKGSKYVISRKFDNVMRDIKTVYWLNQKGELREYEDEQQ